MRRLILALLLLLPLLAVPCSGAEVPSFPQVDELLEEAEGAWRGRTAWRPEPGAF